jgi:hypothetical protein
MVRELLRNHSHVYMNSVWVKYAYKSMFHLINPNSQVSYIYLLLFIWGILLTYICGMSVFTKTTTYNFVACRRKLFQAGCVCWISGGAFCVAVSWLAGGENWSPVKGRPVSSFRWQLGPWAPPSCFFYSVKLWLLEGPSCFFFSVKTVGGSHISPPRRWLFRYLSEQGNECDECDDRSV